MSPSLVGGMALGAFAGRSLWGIHRQGSRGWGASSCSSAMPTARKVVSSVCRVRSLPKSSLTSNLTCFFFMSLEAHSSMGSYEGHSLVGVGASPLYTLLQDFRSFGCRWRSSIEWLSCSSAGCYHGDWEKETGTFLQIEARAPVSL